MHEMPIALEFESVAVIGGGSGIGRALALQLSAMGATVYVLGRRAYALEETAALAENGRGDIRPIVCDARDPLQVEAAMQSMIESSGPIQAVAYCAIEMDYVPARELDVEIFQAGIDSTLLAAFNVLNQWSRTLFDAGLPGSAVLLTSSTAEKGTPGIAHSSAGKAGIQAFVKSAAREWAASGIRLNVIGPGFFPTEKSKDFWSNEKSEPIRDLIGLGRLGELREIVDPIIFFLSTAASYITGEVLSVDGGYSLTPWVMPRWTYDRKPGDGANNV
jgi:NAD(P)-dependent dehydrogenase (short-subunit alcohol dehydrogenase family)